MENKIDKELIRRRFSKSLPSYDSQAAIQKMIASELAEGFTAVAPQNIGALLEVGCGTGFLTVELLKRAAVERLYINDIVAEALPLVKEKTARYAVAVETIEGDAEDMKFPDGIDAIASASTVQWFEDLEQFISKAAGALKEGGIFAFNTFGKDNLRQIRELTGEGLDYIPTGRLEAMLKNEFREVRVWEKQYEHSFDSPFDVLRHLKQTGVTGTGGFRWTKSRLGEFEREYETRFGDEGKVSLTWDVIYVICRK